MNEQGPESVAIGNRPVEVGRSSHAGLRLFHPTVSRNHATLMRAAGGIDVVDRDSRFGTFVNGARVRAVCAQPGDRIQFGTTTVYRVCEDGLRLDSAARGASITAEGVTISKGGRVLLRDAGFSIQPDSFVGILGPSGAGKSTLLNCIASYHQAGVGQIIFDDQNDINEARDEYRAILGHVPQEDVLYPTLTVRENLAFAARLRLGRDAEAGHVNEVVARALERVGLTEHAEKPVAVLSGGQCKRLSVAVELLKRPRLLLLDEPTSGLDPASGANLMEQLRYVASRGTTVICTTHLMENVRLLDIVIVLGVIEGVGQIGYVGPPNEMLAHFQCHSFADLYDKLSAGQFRPATAVPITRAAMPTEQPAPRLSIAVQGVSLLKPLSDASGTSSVSRMAINELVARAIADDVWRQSFIVGWRALLGIWRDQGLWLMMLAQPLVLGLLVCLTQFEVGKLVPVYFFCVVIAIWLGLNNSARDLVRERRHYVRERLAGLRPGGYLGAKWGIYSLVGVAQLILLVAVVRIGSGYVMPEDRARELWAMSRLWFLAMLLASYTCGLGLGLLISAVARTEEAAVAALPLLIMPQLLVSVVAVGGLVEKSHAEDRIFRPLIVTLHSPLADARTGKDSLSKPAVLVDMLSMLCYSRPASLLLESPQVVNAGFSSFIWLGDFCHLLILLLATWAAAYVTFLWAEQRWPGLIGLG